MEPLKGIFCFSPESLLIPIPIKPKLEQGSKIVKPLFRGTGTMCKKCKALTRSKGRFVFLNEHFSMKSSITEGFDVHRQLDKNVY